MELERNPKVSTTTPTAIHDVFAVEKEKERDYEVYAFNSSLPPRHRKSVLDDKRWFFAEKLRCYRVVSHSVEISDCDDVKVYVKDVILMH
ncbi:unnamed protein product [Sphenostylis stenocarpa]|uniref:Uncharacterized protein n=1 Tax=Sphenostylis stenocarpa TaxID=92480 RepID=A0AA86SC56_9FABA|nr:unnamed protein product [Sphenostylis stenocarpa]